MAAGSQALWVQQLKGKYLPRSHLWHSKRGSRCTAFWRGILALRPALQPLVIWSLGDGSTCNIFAQPWFPNSLNHLPQNQQERQTTVNHLVNEESENWDIELLSGRFGYLSAMHIVSDIRPPARNRGPDKLIFTPNTSSQFAVKKAYASLLNQKLMEQGGLQQGANQNLVKLWKHIWQQGEMPPRIRHFIWKLAHGAIPLGATMKARIRRGSADCQLCGDEAENEIHLFFQCPFARTCWFAGLMAIKSEVFKSSIKDSLIQLMEMVPRELWQEVAITFWSIWRCRNDLAFQAIQPSFKAFNTYCSLIRTESMLTASRSSVTTANSTQGMVPLDRLEYQHSVICQIDGSWYNGWRGGTGFVIKKNGTLLAYNSEGAQVCCPLQAEATAMLRGIEFVISLGIPECCFLTDCMVLAESCAATSVPVEIDWRAYREVFHVWKKMKQNIGFSCYHVGREYNMLPDFLAKRGNATGESLTGFTYPICTAAPIE